MAQPVVVEDDDACGTCPNVPCVLISWNVSENVIQWLRVM